MAELRTSWEREEREERMGEREEREGEAWG